MNMPEVSGSNHMFQCVVARQKPDERLASLHEREDQLVEQIKLCNVKLEWITGQRERPKITNSLSIINVMSKDTGFKSILKNIRQRKADVVKLPEIPPEPVKPDFTQVHNIGELIEEFHKFPKIYDSKPTMKKPAKTKVFIKEYEERQQRRELAMNYGTRTRIRRAHYYCNSLTNLYMDPVSPRNRNKPVQHHTSNKPHTIAH